jgi:superfamily II DNA or RNA helicase
LTSELKNDFPRKTREKGENYYRRKAVEIINSEPGRIRARVQGAHLYDVNVGWDDDQYSYNCSCPVFVDRNEPCKHVWATLLAADAKGILPGNVPDADPDDFQQEEDDEEENQQFIPETRLVKLGDREVPFLRYRESTAPSDAKPQRHAIWRRRLTEMRSAWMWREDPAGASWPVDKQIVYVIDTDVSGEDGELAIQLGTRFANKPGDVKRLRLRADQIHLLSEAVDRELISILVGVGDSGDFAFGVREIADQLWLRGGGNNELVRRMCQTGRCVLRSGKDDGKILPIQWDDGEPWRLHLAVVPQAPGEVYRLEGTLRRGQERVGISEPKLIVAGGPVFIGDKAAAFEDGGTFPFAHLLAREQNLDVPVEQGDVLLEELLEFPRLPRLDLPAEMAINESRSAPRPRLKLAAPTAPRSETEKDRLHCTLSFDYGDQNIPHGHKAPAIFDSAQRRIIYRDLDFEKQAVARLRELGFRPENNYGMAPAEFRLLPRRLPAAVAALTVQQWHVEVAGKVYRQPGKIRMQVSSGIDWFELDGDAEFEGVSVKLPRLLKAIRKGETTIVLDDGTVGILPEQWLKRYGLLAAVSEMKDDTIQFTRGQVGLLDALLSEMPATSVDEAFGKARDELHRFEGILPVNPPESFIGSLRPYQCEGLGWLDFLRTFGLHGCLADDMGLGKTIQVLALLERRRLLRTNAQTNGGAPAGPSLVVVPRSLVFNWHAEAAKFTPQLRVLDHASADRLKGTDHFRDFDVILTTYGTLRNDIAQWKDTRFDYVILDEAQAIKNAASESAKAARLLKADHRLALSGTPVQNHLGELWSLLEFLNPGMLGASSAFASLTNSADRAGGAETRQLLAHALRPFILRRTKEQVARDLPEKFEQTIFCELEKKQRALYDELKEHYRHALLGRIEREGLGKSKLQILEALLRLRQAACHPGLLDRANIDEASAKLDTLLPRLAEVADEGHKAIVFSQFTSFLAIVRKKLDEQGVVYEYLDGKTRDRQPRVERFQSDPDCRLFLVSLKAGGLGLNLTAAQYVFLLDPWWNPAVEAQAIDRAHRIGQTRQVFAYRLIAKDTVEEKVLKLQQSKRDLADAIINADNALISKLGRDDLELLLS